jgi:2'-5' RNA ligase
MRLFIGVPLALATTRDLGAEVKRLQSTKTNPALPDNLRWSDPESWHITLQFLGSTSPEKYECVIARLRAVHHSQVLIELGRIGTFPRAGILFADVRVTPELTALQQTITAANSPCGFTLEDRPYHPHITLARQKGKHGDKNFAGLTLQTSPPAHFTSFTADSFILYESTPTPEGSRYEIRERFPLTEE